MKTKSRSILLLSILAALAALSASGCGKSSVEDADEITQSVGDAMSGLDESARSGGALANYIPSTNSRFAKMNRSWSDRFQLIPEAQATACALVPSWGFGSCASGVVTRTFDYGGSACTVGLISWSGTVSFTMKDGSGTGTCAFGSWSDGYSITRAPNYTITGRRGASIAVSSDGGGQRLTKTGTGTYSWDTLGVRRVATSAAGAQVFDISTKTNSSITVTGSNRLNRTLTGGELQITHNLKNYVVKLTPSGVTWTSSCNCPTSGKWSGSATGDEKSDSFVIEFTGCGTATVTANDTSTDVTLDRCSSAL